MSLEQLYQEKILAFARSARQSGTLDDAGYSATITNPTCGDRVRVDLDLDGNRQIARLGAEANGCALCEAATGLLLTVAPGQPADAVAGLADEIETWLRGERDSATLEGQDAFTPVKAFASRHGCVSLPFQAAAKALTEATDKAD